MTKAKLVVMAAVILGSIVTAAFATGVPGEAVKAFCGASAPRAGVTTGVAPDAGAP